MKKSNFNRKKLLKTLGLGSVSAMVTACDLTKYVDIVARRVKEILEEAV